MTRYKLEIDDTYPDTEAVADVLSGIAGRGWSSWEFEEILQGNPTKWYDWREHMQTVSLSFPGVLFTLSGEGEEAGDQWIAWFRDGASCVERRPKWNPPPFDSDALYRWVRPDTGKWFFGEYDLYWRDGPDAEDVRQAVRGFSEWRFVSEDRKSRCAEDTRLLSEMWPDVIFRAEGNHDGAWSVLYQGGSLVHTSEG